MLAALYKDRFPNQKKSKLSAKGDFPFKVVQKINNNAYRLEHPIQYGVSHTFNIHDLISFTNDDHQEGDLKTNHFQEARYNGKNLCQTLQSHFL